MVLGVLYNEVQQPVVLCTGSQIADRQGIQASGSRGLGKVCVPGG
jgi:hypothetical protein